MINNIKRIEVPMFKVGDYILNEYEVRQLMVDVKNKEQEPNIKVIDLVYGTEHIILETARFDKQPKSLALTYELAFKLMD